ncbi:S1 domain-containing post-transcriptional regulator GSP13 [Bacillus carboniphilus]|uniref:S1 domain-containing post-transcriptional regulator GSP13 n=1 Tax=Bacillus carboniphilus TaxID=86663 RepID=A0ABY9JPB0_9BACI|nr:S1 domain-containing post-transcriptional regulator GSP13 [Bacillus carboniphilus]WLR41244.1 S1 domain-containing post-transcriptional regulator GSP13 [Bacillus carboniphilus]
METNIEVGNVLTGKVAGIQSYGAFIELDDQTQGLVHISEVTNGFVKDINDHLKLGQEVKVKILSVEENKKKISLSIRQTEEKAPKKKAPKKSIEVENSSQGFNTLKDKLEEWIEQSSREDLLKK